MTTRPPRWTCLALCAALSLVACAAPTGYERASLWNDGYGWSDKALGDGEHSITVRGNSLTSTERAADLALLRAAHLALEHDCARFVLVDQEALLRKQDQFDNAAVVRGGGTLVVPVQRRTTKEPVALLLIRLLPDDAPSTPGEVDAHALVAELEAALA